MDRSSTWAAQVKNGVLVTSFSAYQPRTFALKMGKATATVVPVHSSPVELQYDLAAATNDGSSSTAGFNGKGDSLPAEILPSDVTFNDVHFHLPQAKTDVPDALIAKGQSINLPGGHFNRVYLLAASDDGDQKADFEVGGNDRRCKRDPSGGPKLTPIGDKEARLDVKLDADQFTINRRRWPR
jgi:alpha-mannosidase